MNTPYNLLDVSVIDRIRACYVMLERQIIRALVLHLGDPPRLQQYRQLVMEFRTSAQHHHEVFPTHEWSRLSASLSDMLEDLDNAVHASIDPPDRSPIKVITLRNNPGAGRPRLDIDPNILAAAIKLESVAEISRQFGCSRKTVRRRALELGLVQPCPPVRLTEVHSDGTTATRYRSYQPRMSVLSNEEIDKLLHEILTDFPSLGRQMISGMIRTYGLRISRQQIRDSYYRVVGIPPGFGGPPRIQRRVYNVAGPGALTHMDGWHGLIKFGIVIHMFIDGFSRYITALGVHDNNRANTVLSLFEKAIAETGLPSRVRGDHGGENMEVARKMEVERGRARNSFIWGRSVHNIRVERTWRDLNQVFGLKWKNFFLNLTVCEGLTANDLGHRWLLHHLFLEDIRADAEGFRQGWNKHVMQLEGRNYSPESMFFFGMIQRGPRGLDEVPLESVPDPDEYGVDWQALEAWESSNEDEGLEDSDTGLNLDDYLERDDEHNIPLAAPTLPPRTLNIVHVPSNSCPLSELDVEAFDATLVEYMGLNFTSRSMDIRRQKWSLGLRIYNAILSENT